MKAIALTVNGEPRTVLAPARMQLAELLRDGLDLTGTHLGCEHGVCGACTVILDGRPVRSCITYAHACEGAAVETVEGFAGDEVMTALRTAFARHHALQCGFCTPGMLATAWDIVRRIPAPDDARIRRELSGNLCRCTGYMGIVAAVAEVAERYPAAPRAELPPPVPALPLAPFEVAQTHPLASVVHRGGLVTEGGWSSLERAFTLEHTADEVWALFEDLERLLPCLPGARLESTDGDAFTARVSVRFGPIRADFAGEGTRRRDRDARTGVIAGSGRDGQGRSRLGAELEYRLGPEPDRPATGVDARLRFRIEGPLAQFNRADLVESFADVMLERFAANCDRLLAGGTVSEQSAGGFGLMLRGLRVWVRRVLSR